MRSSLPLAILGALLGAACAAPGYRLAALPDAWQQVRARSGSTAYHHAGGGTIAAGATCGDADDVPLDVLTNHLLFGLEQRHERARTPLTVQGRGALRTQLDGTLDGVRVALDLVVLKRDGCTYDLMLIAPPGLFAARQIDFERFIGGFVQVARR